MIKVIALFREYLVGWYTTLDYEDKPTNDRIDHLYVVDQKNRQKYRIDLWATEQPCGSGYCMSTYGCMEIHPVNYIGPFNYLPKDPLHATLDASIQHDEEGHFDWVEENPGEEYDVIYNRYFQYSYDYGDAYYPMGFAIINMEQFEKLPRAIEGRPVWIFQGESGLGKSSLAMLMRSGKTVFETDSLEDDDLPDEIVADIVVLGNRHGFTRDDIVNHLFGTPTVIDVCFSKED